MLLPEFTLQAYDDLLRALLDVGYAIGPVSTMPQPVDGPTVYLRHDIDLHVPGVERMAAVESALGVRSTYYVMVAQHYNPLYPPNRAVLRALADAGHELGLHYDLADYPDDPAAARARLDDEVRLIEAIAGRPVTTVSMHQPGLSGQDPFRQTGAYVHPHDPALADGLTYISDSCRAWRDETLLRCFGADKPQRLLLLAHPEVWLAGPGVPRMTYLDEVVMANTVAQHRDFVDVTVREVWRNHVGPKLHDARESAAR